jgi:hypothetical protein
MQRNKLSSRYDSMSPMVFVLVKSQLLTGWQVSSSNAHCRFCKILKHVNMPQPPSLPFGPLYPPPHFTLSQRHIHAATKYDTRNGL